MEEELQRYKSWPDEIKRLDSIYQKIYHVDSNKTLSDEEVLSLTKIIQKASKEEGSAYETQVEDPLSNITFEITYNYLDGVLTLDEMEKASPQDVIRASFDEEAYSRIKNQTKNNDLEL